MSAPWYRRRLTIAVAFAALPVLAVGGTAAAVSFTRSQSTQNQSAQHTSTQSASAKHDSGEQSLAGFLRDHPQLNKRSASIAFLREKLGRNGGEASQEILNGPAQEAYDNRAFPRTSVAPAQTASSRAAFGQATARAQGLAPNVAGPTAVAGPWQPVGPNGAYVPGTVTYTGQPSYVSGRTTALALAKNGRTIFAVTAGGGLWRATLGQYAWQHIGGSIPSTAIGTVYVAPDGTLYVGTGEQNGSSDSEAGVGLYRSTDNGASFHRVPTIAKVAGRPVDFAVDRGLGAIVADPKNAKHLYAGTTVARHGSSSVNGGRYTPPGVAPVGLYETTDGGQHWVQTLSRESDAVDGTSATGNDLFRGGISMVQFDPANPSVVYAAMDSYGLFRRFGSTWRAIYKIHQYGSVTVSATSRLEFAAVKADHGKTRIYLGDATRYGDATMGFVSGFLRTDSARAVKPSWTTLSNPTKGTDGYGSYNFCQAQCSYDQAVTVSPANPNIVYLSGSMNYNEIFTANQPSNGRAVIRSTDAGKSFTDMTNDVAGNGLHPDQHALLVLPGGSKTNEHFVTASDGGIVDQRGPFVNRSKTCDSRGLKGADLTDCRMFLRAIPASNSEENRGLQTLQLQSVSVGAGNVLQGGTQDNGTLESDGPSNRWFESVGGDGGQSGFDSTNNVPNNQIRYHSYYAPQHDVNFHGNNPKGWDFISDPLLASGEGASFYTPFTADPVNEGYVYDGLQHVWRTTDHGGPRGYLDKHCNELTGDFTGASGCGDFVRLGGNQLNDQGDLSGTYYGADNAGASNYVVAIERATTDKNTMWAATRRGRLFLSTNANAKNANNVKYTRLDQKLGLPTRFISGIYLDPANPYHLWLSYSGYSAYAPGGHVYEVTVNPKTGAGTATDLSSGLGDQPVDDIVRAPNGTLYAGTDFGVVYRAPGSTTWRATTGLPPVATFGLTLAKNGMLYAATHGRSVWQLKVG